MATSLRTMSRSCWAAVGAAGLAVALTAAPVNAAQPEGCTGAERREALRTEQADVLRSLGESQEQPDAPDLDHTILENEAELAALAAPDPVTGRGSYNLLDHQFASARGIGIAIIDTASLATGVTRGEPNLLLYAPNPNATNVIDPFGPDFPYELVGWGYTPNSYNWNRHPPELDGPNGRCLTRADWFVHERSVHPFDTWQNVPAPPEPEEAFPGAEPNDEVPIPPDECEPAPCPAGIDHPRIWDIHLWREGAGQGVPSLSILHPRARIPGWDPDVGVSFFYPARQPE